MHVLAKLVGKIKSTIFILFIGDTKSTEDISKKSENAIIDNFSLIVIFFFVEKYFTLHDFLILKNFLTKSDLYFFLKFRKMMDE